VVLEHVVGEGREGEGAEAGAGHADAHGHAHLLVKVLAGDDERADVEAAGGHAAHHSVADVHD